MSVQPLSGKELLNLPEAQRSRRMMKAYSSAPLQTVNESGSQKADLVTYDGTLFEVQKVERWREGDKVDGIHFWKILLVERNP